MSKRTEVPDFKLRAYRTIELGDKKFQNWKQASTVELLFVVEIDGVEIPIASQNLAHQVWERSIKAYGKEPDEEKGAG